MGEPQAGGQLSGEVTRQAAIKRMQKVQQMEAQQKFRKPSASVNTGATGLPKPGGLGLKQEPGQVAYSPHPPKPRRI